MSRSHFRPLFALLFLTLTSGPVQTVFSQTPDQSTQDFNEFIGDLVAVSKTGPGTLSAEGFTNELHRTKASLARLHKIDADQLSFDDRIDWQFAESILKSRELNLEANQLWKKDPRVYLVTTRVTVGTWITDAGVSDHKFVGLPAILGAPGDSIEKTNELLLFSV